MAKIEDMRGSPDLALPEQRQGDSDTALIGPAPALLAELAGERGSQVPRTGAVALMTAVLEEAIRSCFSAGPQIRAEAEAWLTSGHRRSIFSFLVICETLALDPDATRAAIMQLVVGGASRKSVRRTRPNIRRHLVAGEAEIPRRRRSRPRSRSRA